MGVPTCGQLRVRDPYPLLLLPLLARAHRHTAILQRDCVDTSDVFAYESRLAPRAAREEPDRTGKPAQALITRMITGFHHRSGLTSSRTIRSVAHLYLCNLSSRSTQSPMPFQAILREVDQLRNVDTRLETLAEQNLFLSEPLTTLVGSVRNSADGSKWGSEIEVKSVSIQGVKRRDPALPGRTAAAAVRSDAVQRKEALRRPVWKQPAAASNSAGLGLHR